MTNEEFTPPNPSRERAQREYAGLFRIAERHGSTAEQRARQSHPEMLDPLGAIRIVAAIAGASTLRVRMNPRWTPPTSLLR